MLESKRLVNTVSFPQGRKANGCVFKRHTVCWQARTQAICSNFSKKCPHGTVMSEQPVVPIVFLSNKGPHTHSSIFQATHHNTFFPDGHVPSPNGEDNVLVKRWPLNSVDGSIMDSVEAHWLLCCWDGKGHFIFNNSVSIPTWRMGRIPVDGWLMGSKCRQQEVSWGKWICQRTALPLFF